MSDVERACIHCRESWPLDEEFYYRRADDRSKFMGMCIACYLEYQHARRKKPEQRVV